LQMYGNYLLQGQSVELMLSNHVNDITQGT